MKLLVWKGKLLSLGCRLILLNYVFSTNPLYYIAMFKIPKRVISKIDQIKKYFL